MAEDDGHSIVLGAGDLGLAPTRGAARVLVLDEQMRGADLALLLALAVGSQTSRAVVGAHVMLQSLAVGAGRRLPSALLGRGVEIVGKVLGVGVSNLPAAGKTGSLERAGHVRGKRESESGAATSWKTRRWRGKERLTMILEICGLTGLDSLVQVHALTERWRVRGCLLCCRDTKPNATCEGRDALGTLARRRCPNSRRSSFRLAW